MLLIHFFLLEFTKQSFYFVTNFAREIQQNILIKCKEDNYAKQQKLGTPTVPSCTVREKEIITITFVSGRDLKITIPGRLIILSQTNYLFILISNYIEIQQL